MITVLLQRIQIRETNRENRASSGSEGVRKRPRVSVPFPYGIWAFPYQCVHGWEALLSMSIQNFHPDVSLCRQVDYVIGHVIEFNL